MEYYNKALLEKLVATKVPTIMSNSEKFLEDIEVDQSKTKRKFPYIRLMRQPITFKDDGLGSLVERLRGIKGVPGRGNIMTMTKSIPINLQYQIEVLSRDNISAEGLLVDLIFFLVENPILSIKLGNVEKPIDFPILLKELEDVTELSEFSEKGKLYRYILVCEIQEARIFAQSEVKYISKPEIIIKEV